jgi:hypothetical protein
LTGPPRSQCTARSLGHPFLDQWRGREDENAGTNLARLPASQAEAQSDGKATPVRRVTVKRANHPGRVAA